jgi:acyl carrier protein
VTDALDVLRSMIATVTDIPRDQIDRAVRFDELVPWSSLPALQLLASIEREYQIEFDVREYLEIETLAGLARVISERVSGSISALSSAAGS